MSSFYNSVPKIMIICYTVLEIWCVTDVIIFNFGPFFTFLLPQQLEKSEFWKNEKKLQGILSFYICVPKIMIRWCVVPEIWCVTDVLISHFGLFLPFYLPNSQKSQSFEKMKKMPREIIILYMCTKNYNHMMYSSWDMGCERCNCNCIILNL